MKSHAPGVMAAPNSARVKARILRVTQSEQYPDKWALELEILEAQNVSGPNFVRIGERVNGFTFMPAWTLPVPVTIKATAEYIGDAQTGAFQLTDLHPCE